jgi:AAA domain
MFDFESDFKNFGFEEDILPPGQKTIHTRNIEKFNRVVKLLLDAKQLTGYSAIALATGRAGCGKSVAILNFLNNLAPHPHTGFPACIAIHIRPDSNPRTVVQDLYACFKEPIPRFTRHQYADEAAEVILAYDVKLIFVDESDLLGKMEFEFLRFVYGKTKCPLVIVGLPSISTLINKHEKFAGRVGPRIRFLPPDEDEVLTTILPNLVFPHWSFDPTNEGDLAMGRELWSKARSSFRELRMILQFASTLARDAKKECITPHILNLAYATHYRHAPIEEIEEEDSESDSQRTQYEEDSENRHIAKQRKEGGGDESGGQ